MPNGECRRESNARGRSVSADEEGWGQANGGGRGNWSGQSPTPEIDATTVGKDGIATGTNAGRDRAIGRTALGTVRRNGWDSRSTSLAAISVTCGLGSGAAAPATA